MPSLRCLSKKRLSSKKTNHRQSDSEAARLNNTDDDKPERQGLRKSQVSSFVLCGDDIVINATKKSKKRMSGLELEKHGDSLVVKRILEGSLFDKTGLVPDMELRVINGIQCSKLDGIEEVYEMIREAKGAVTIVARENLKKETNDLSSEIQPPNRWSSGAAHMWLEMTQYVQRKNTPQYPLLPPTLQRKEYCLRKAELHDEHIEAPPAPKFKKTSRPKTLPSKLEVLNKSSCHSTMSEITLNPSQHQTIEPTDIVVTVAAKPQKAAKKRISSVKSILADLYPDYDGEEEEDILSYSEKSSTESQATEDVSLTPTSLVRENAEDSTSRFHGIDVSPPPMDDDEGSIGFWKRGARHMVSTSLHPPSIPRVGA